MIDRILISLVAPTQELPITRAYVDFVTGIQIAPHDLRRTFAKLARKGKLLWSKFTANGQSPNRIHGFR